MSIQAVTAVEPWLPLFCQGLPLELFRGETVIPGQLFRVQPAVPRRDRALGCLRRRFGPAWPRAVAAGDEARRPARKQGQPHAESGGVWAVQHVSALGGRVTGCVQHTSVLGACPDVYSAQVIRTCPDVLSSQVPRCVQGPARHTGCCMPSEGLRAERGPACRVRDCVLSEGLHAQ